MARSVVVVSALLVVAVAYGPQARADEVRGSAGPRFVRVSAPGFAEKPVVGELMAADDIAVTIQDSRGQEIVVPASQVTRMEVRRQAGRKRRGLLVGALTGLAAGAVLGAAAGDDCSSQSFVCFDRGSTALALGATGALVGAGIGALVAPGEKWDVVDHSDLSVSMTPLLGRHRTVGMLVTLGF